MIALLLGLTGCATFTGARPLEPGQHEVGASLGGPFVSALGIVTPLPMLIAQGRSGVAMVGDRPFDLSYGMNLTGLPFGILQGHVGVAWELLAQAGWVPALAISTRVFLASNPLWFGVERSELAVSFWAANQTELLASWMPGGQLIYTGLAQYTDFGAPSLLLTPILGTELDFGLGGFRLQIETRYFAVGRSSTTQNVNWFPGGRGGAGALGFSLGFGYRF